MPEKYILAFDGTPGSEKAAHRTREIMGPHPADELLVVWVLPADGVSPDRRAEAKERLRDKVKELVHLGYRAQGILTEGDVVETLMNMITFHEPKLLVIARSDYESAHHPAIDSVADELARNAPCPVLIVT